MLRVKKVINFQSQPLLPSPPLPSCSKLNRFRPYGSQAFHGIIIIIIIIIIMIIIIIIIIITTIK